MMIAISKRRIVVLWFVEAPWAPKQALAGPIRASKERDNITQKQAFVNGRMPVFYTILIYSKEENFSAVQNFQILRNFVLQAGTSQALRCP
jgi:hypothetical protein